MAKVELRDPETRQLAELIEAHRKFLEAQSQLSRDALADLVRRIVETYPTLAKNLEYAGVETFRVKHLAEDQTDWDHVDRLTDKDIARAAASDPDTVAPGADWFKDAKLVLPKTKEVVTLRLDPDVLDWFRKTGKGYQTRINSVLRAFIEAQQPGKR